MSVLAKSAAALLIKRDLRVVPSAWRIYAVPYSGATDAINFDDLLGPTKSFDTGVHVWRKQLSNTEWTVVFRAKSILLHLVFVFTEKEMGPMVKQIFSGSFEIRVGYATCGLRREKSSLPAIRKMTVRMVSSRV